MERKEEREALRETLRGQTRPTRITIASRTELSNKLTATCRGPSFLRRRDCEGIGNKQLRCLNYARITLAVWSSGMIPVLGTGGQGFNSPNGPFLLSPPAPIRVKKISCSLALAIKSRASV